MKVRQVQGIENVATAVWFATNYLRANGKARRLTAMGEFNWHKEKPMEIGRYDASIFEVLDDNDNPVYQISGGDLRRWYENIYSPLISQNHDL